MVADLITAPSTMGTSAKFVQNIASRGTELGSEGAGLRTQHCSNVASRFQLLVKLRGDTDLHSSRRRHEGALDALTLGRSINRHVRSP